MNCSFALPFFPPCLWNRDLVWIICVVWPCVHDCSYSLLIASHCVSCIVPLNSSSVFCSCSVTHILLQPTINTGEIYLLLSKSKVTPVHNDLMSMRLILSSLNPRLFDSRPFHPLLTFTTFILQAMKAWCVRALESALSSGPTQKIEKAPGHTCKFSYSCLVSILCNSVMGSRGSQILLTVHYREILLQSD